MLITYRTGDKYSPPKGYTIHLWDKDVEEYGADVATFGRQNRDDFYKDRKDWVRFTKTLDTYLAKSKRVVLCMHGSFSHRSMYTENVLRFILQHLGIRCYSKQSFKVVVFDKDGEGGHWIQQCINDTCFVIEAQLIAMLPPNVATPKRMQQLLRELFRSVPNAKMRIFSSGDLHRNGFGLINAVGDSAETPPYMVVVERAGKQAKRAAKHAPQTLALVGKGVTFDSGGLSLKPNEQLVKMKYDKIGAIYAAYATYQLMQDAALKHHTFIGVFPFAENAISGKAVHSGDVVKSYLGKTVEITDPDAEGRLLLADALGYLHSYKPDVILDIATLTGHAELIHCDHSGYFFSSKDEWKLLIEKASYELGERMIAMPSWTSGYEDLLKSRVADVMNSPPKKACASSSFVATMFLKEFVPRDCDWLHIDLAHEIEDSIPKGHGIRTMIHAVHSWLSKK